MTFDVVFDEDAIKFLGSLNKSIRERIFQKLLSTKENPFIYFERLSGRPDYKLRVGQFRVIADIDVKNKRIEVIVIGKRQNIYDKI